MKNFRGKVVQGARRGKSLGFPTANIALHQEIEEGIYLSKVTIHEKSQNRHPELVSGSHAATHNALTFVGKAVTFNETKVQAESYLLDFSGNLYGKYITVQILKKLRNNKRFESVEELKKQMHEDLVNARKFFLEWC